MQNNKARISQGTETQPLLFAPGELLRCGLRDAHSFPLVGRRDSDGAICATWREPPSTAWERQVIELGRTATSHAALILDCDSRDSVERAMASCVGAGPVPLPNFASTRLASGNMHIGYFLGRPVHRGAAARAKPLGYLGRVSEYYRAALGADPWRRQELFKEPLKPKPRTKPRTPPRRCLAIQTTGPINNSI